MVIIRVLNATNATSQENMVITFSIEFLLEVLLNHHDFQLRFGFLLGAEHSL